NALRYERGAFFSCGSKDSNVLKTSGLPKNICEAKIFWEKEQVRRKSDVFCKKTSKKPNLRRNRVSPSVNIAIIPLKMRYAMSVAHFLVAGAKIRTF
ncbi:MAG: hypothetical protein SOX77_06730, partial [Candidatus Borkfalkiaceae bacterium]|nr:hypothetical protein [Christensenellaceae bacterium]